MYCFCHYNIQVKTEEGCSVPMSVKMHGRKSIFLKLVETLDGMPGKDLNVLILISVAILVQPYFRLTSIFGDMSFDTVKFK